MKKRRVLCLADSPTCVTGFATVSRNVLKNLYDSGRYEIDMVGINYEGTFNRDKFTEEFYYLNTLVPAKRMNSSDMYGREYTLLALTGAFPELVPPYDIFFTIQDHFILQQKAQMGHQSFAENIKQLQQNTLQSKYHTNIFSWVGYYPIDGIIKQDWVDDCIAKTNYPVAYCDFGYEQIMRFATKDNKLADRVRVIRHGTNTTDFYPLSKAQRTKYRAQYFPMIDKDTFLIINVNRNQIRKDFLRTMLIYKEFKKIVPDSFLYLHCDPRDVGGNIYDIANSIGLKHTEFAVPAHFNPQNGIPVSELNKVYNCADVNLTTTLGEGWGLSITEAMATKLPVAAPNITSIPELLNSGQKGRERGFTFTAGKTHSEVVNFGTIDNEVLRPISNVDEAITTLLTIYKDKKLVAKRVERAYKYATQLTWENEGKKWLDLFDEVCLVNDGMRKNGATRAVGKDKNGKNYAISKSKKARRIGRNDPCPICANDGIHIKIKKCQKHRQHFL